MIKAILAILLIFLVQVAMANDISIIDVRRNIPLSDDEPSYQDFYINAGTEDGLKKNLVVNVFRPTNIRDTSGAQSFGEIQIPVAQVRILAAYPKISVAREYKILPREENPMLEQPAIMNGDRIDLKNSFVDNKPIRKPQAVVVAPPLTPTMTLVVPAPAVAAPANPVNSTAEAQTAPAAEASN